MVYPHKRADFLFQKKIGENRAIVRSIFRLYRQTIKGRAVIALSQSVSLAYSNESFWHDFTFQLLYSWN